MTVGQLIEHLNKFPLDLKVWHSDAGYAEGAARSIEPVKILAYGANLDGDEIDDEWIYDKQSFYWKNQGYTEVEHEVLSKEIVLLKSTMDV